MLPLSFHEYCLGNTENMSLPEKYTAYLENSSFPYTLQYGNDKKAIRDYLESLYNTVLLKDVVARYKISDVLMLESVVKFIFDNIGNQLSTAKIANTMTSAGRKIDPKTVEKYIRALMDGLIVYQAKRYDVKGKQYLKTLEKYYTVDIGLRYMLLGRRDADIGHILENVVYLELIRRGYDVYVGLADGNEVDFVAMDTEGATYFQVAASVRDEKTLAREIGSLRRISDHYPKYLLTLDPDPAADYAGIKRINATEWLMK
jgi:predicted AAA+ superfamily ATPase